MIRGSRQYYGYSREELWALHSDQINELPPAEVAAERQRALIERRNYFEFSRRLAKGEVRGVFDTIDDAAHKYRLLQAEALIRAYNKDPSLASLRLDERGKIIP